MSNVIVATASGNIANLFPSKLTLTPPANLPEGPSFYSVSVAFNNPASQTIYLPDGTQVTGCTATFDQTTIKNVQKLSPIRGLLFNVNPGSDAGNEWGNSVLLGDWLIVTDTGQIVRIGVQKRFGFGSTALDYAISPAQVSGAVPIVSEFPSKIQLIKLEDSNAEVFGEGNFIFTNYDVAPFMLQTEMGMGA